MPDLPPLASPGVARCWQIMTEQWVATRADAIDYLWTADCFPGLSIEEIRGLVEAFPLMSSGRASRGDCDDHSG